MLDNLSNKADYFFFFHYVDEKHSHNRLYDTKTDKTPQSKMKIKSFILYCTKFKALHTASTQAIDYLNLPDIHEHQHLKRFALICNII